MTSFKTECPSPVELLTLASDGENLTGYAGGLDKKLWLLSHEGTHTSNLK